MMFNARVHSRARTAEGDMLNPSNTIENNGSLSGLLIGYFLWMCLVAISAHFMPFLNVSIIHWLGNLLGFTVFSALILRKTDWKNRFWLILAGAVLVARCIPLLFFHDHLFESAQLLGVNVNTPVQVIYIVVLGALLGASMSIGDIEKLLQVISLGAAAICFAAIIMDWENIVLQFTDFSINAYAIPVKGVFPNKNMLGALASAGMMSSFYLFCNCNKYWVLNYTLFVLIGVTLLLSLCRSGMILVAVFFVIFCSLSILSKSCRQRVLANKKIFLIRLAAIMAVGLVLGALLVFSPTFQKFLIHRVIRLDDGYATRLEALTGIVDSADQSAKSRGLHIISTLFGIGPTEVDAKNFLDAHNIYVQIYAVGGIMKLLLYAFFFGFSVFLSTRLRKKHPLFAIFSVSVLGSYMVFGFFEAAIIMELGLFNFLMTLFILFLPASCVPRDEFLRNKQKLSTEAKRENTCNGKGYAVYMGVKQHGRE